MKLGVPNEESTRISYCPPAAVSLSDSDHRSRQRHRRRIHLHACHGRTIPSGQVHKKKRQRYQRLWKLMFQSLWQLAHFLVYILYKFIDVPFGYINHRHFPHSLRKFYEKGVVLDDGSYNILIAEYTLV